MKRVLGNLIALVFALGVATAIGEVAARRFTPAPLARPEPQVRYDPDSVRTFTLRPNQTAYTLAAPVHIDADGVRTNGEPAPGGDSSAIVLALGDSFTFGLGVADSATWPAQLERDLREHATRPVRVVNTGTVSYGVFQEMDLLRRKGLALHPAVIVHALYWNDYMSAHAPAPSAPPVLTADGEFVWDAAPAAGSFPRTVARWLVSRSRLTQVLLRIVRGQNTGDYGHAYARLIAGKLDSTEWTPVRAFYRDLRAISDSIGARLYVVIMPVNGIVGRRDAGAQAYVKFARRMLEGQGIRTVDGFAVLRDHRVGKSRAFLPQGPDSHLAPLGYRLLAQALADSLADDPNTAQALDLVAH
jgi:lysophospholipase L1-like esterase